jgi:TPR repeat protein
MKAFKHLKKVTDNSYPAALFQLGIMYHCGYGVEKNMEQGEKCFVSLIKFDHDYEEQIAHLYHTHNEMQDFDKALEWYTVLEKSLDEGLGGGIKRHIKMQLQFNMGLVYEYGNGVKQNYQKAFEYYKNLADDDIEAGIHRLALMYYYGKCVPVDYKESFSLFEQSLSAALLSINLPFVHYQSRLDANESQKNLVYSIKTYREVRGETYYYLGLMHRHGQGVLQDEEKARGYFELAFDCGCKRAKYEL